MKENDVKKVIDLLIEDKCIWCEKTVKNILYKNHLPLCQKCRLKYLDNQVKE